MKKAGLPTGNKGFSLIEILLALVILVSGVCFIFPTMVRMTSLLKHLDCQYRAHLILNNLIVDTEKDLSESNRLEKSLLKDTIEQGGVEYSYEVRIAPRADSYEMFDESIELGWTDFKKNVMKKTAILYR